MGVTGEVFWKGPNKYGPGERLGVRGDDGQTYWTADADVVPSDSKPDLSPGEQYDRGDRVQFLRNGEQVSGEVFWTGQSRGGPGQRLGVRVEGEEDPTWIDARLVRAAQESTAASAAPERTSRGRAEPSPDELDDEMPADWAPPLDLHDLPPPAPVDDDMIDGFALEEDEA